MPIPRGGRRESLVLTDDLEPIATPTLRSRLIVSFVVLGMFVMLQGIAGVFALRQVTDNGQRVSTGITPVLVANSAVQSELLNLARRTDQPVSPQAAQRLRGLLADLDVTGIGGAVPVQQRIQEQAIADWLAEPDDSQRLSAALHANEQLSGSLAQARNEALQSNAETAHWWLLALTAASTVSVLLTSWAAARMVGWFAGPLRDVVGGLERLRLGDVSARITPRGPREVRMVGSAVNHLAEQTALVRALREESTRLRRGTLDGALAVREKIAYGEVVQAGLAAIARTLQVDLVWFIPVEADGLGDPAGLWAEPTFATVVDVQAVVHRTRVPLTLSRLADMWSDGLVQVSNDVDWVPKELGLVEGGVSAFGTGTLIKVPLVAGDELMGCAVLLDSAGNRDLSSEEVSALLVMASNTAVGLQHSRMFANQQELVTRLQELDRQKTAFMSNVSHELRTPLTSIAGYTEMLTDGDAGPVSGPMTGMLEAIDRNTKRLGLLIDDLLALSRIESAGYRIVATTVNVAELIDRAVETVTPQVNSKALTLVVDRGAGDLRLTGDNTQLERCLLNLMSNAVKFTPQGGTVRLSAELQSGAAGEEVVLQVADSGIGIPKADQEHLFTRFFRASNAVDMEIPGTGLGLAIVRGIVEHHGGRMELESEAGEGTTVSLVFPRPEVTETGPALGIPSQRGTAISGSGGTVEH